MNYSAFLDSKRLIVPSTGREIESGDVHSMLFPFQRDLVRWALRKGRAAIFADTGLGKTFMQLEWARLTGERALIVAPLAVARQTVREAERLGIDLTYARSQADAGVMTITNYEMIDRFDAAEFGAVVLDESSILKSFTGKTRTKLIETFSKTAFRLCCTATPAPNDIAELANHAEFLGVMSRVEMLAMFFVHDDEGWRMRGHAREPFYRWLASWGMTLLRPSDLGYSDDGYILPKLSIEHTQVVAEYVPEGRLFFTGLKGIGDRSKVRRGTLVERVERAAELINGDSESWIAWVGLNDEGRMLAERLDDCVLVEGSQSPEEKAHAVEQFVNGDVRVMITKPSIVGFGMNFQHCARMVFVGLSDSYEQYYQCIRRCYRYGQSKPVAAHIILSDAEDAVYANVMRKEREAALMSNELVKHVAQFEKAELGGVREDFIYEEREASGENWRMMLGDSTQRLAELESDSIDLSVFSPPFLSLYTYTPTERDLGNSKDSETFRKHFGFIINELLRVTKPGRNVCVHIAQTTTTKAIDGVIGLRDLRGMTIIDFEQAGFIYHGEVCIDKDPQAQAIRTHSKALLFVQLRKDASWLRPALADYILVFRKPGENAVPVHPDISNNEWIEWARPIWYGIRESNTLNAAMARGNKDDRHIVPLQLETIERCIRLWSNEGEMVLSPFAGIGSEGYQAIKLGRRFVGCELKPEYFDTAVKNLTAAEASKVDLFSYQATVTPRRGHATDAE